MCIRDSYQCFRPAPEGSDAARIIACGCVRGRDCRLTVSFLCHCLSEGGNGKAARVDRLASMVGGGSETLEGVLQRAVHKVDVYKRQRVTLSASFAPSHSLFISISNINHLQHCEGSCEGSSRIHRPSHLRIPTARTPLR